MRSVPKVRSPGTQQKREKPSSAMVERDSTPVMDRLKPCSTYGWYI